MAQNWNENRWCVPGTLILTLQSWALEKKNRNLKYWRHSHKRIRLRKSLPSLLQCFVVWSGEMCAPCIQSPSTFKCACKFVFSAHLYNRCTYSVCHTLFMAVVRISSFYKHWYFMQNQKLSKSKQLSFPFVSQRLLHFCFIYIPVPFVLTQFVVFFFVFFCPSAEAKVVVKDFTEGMRKKRLWTFS